MNIFVSPGFKRKYRKLPIEVKQQAQACERLFREDPFHPRLETHKLHGKLKGFWAFSISSSDRILFEFLDKDSVSFVDVGDHSIYK